MTQDEVQKLCEWHGLFFKDISYGRLTKGTVMLLTLHQIINHALKFNHPVPPGATNNQQSSVRDADAQNRKL